MTSTRGLGSLSYRLPEQSLVPRKKTALRGEGLLRYQCGPVCPDVQVSGVEYETDIQLFWLMKRGRAYPFPTPILFRKGKVIQ